ncbi:MAG: zinc-ribbon domain-containing protein [Pseudomonadota bacterium]
MIVQCHKCSTKFNLDDSKLGAEGAWVRCSKCTEVFQVFPEGQEPAPPAPAAPGPPPAEDDDLGLDLGASGGEREVDASDLAEFGLETDDGEPAATGGPGKAFKVIFWLIGIIIFLALLSLGAVVALDRLNKAPQIVDLARRLPGMNLVLLPKGAVREKERPGEIKMALSNVRGYFRQNDKAGRIFVIQGLVESQHKDVRTAILVRGRLQDAKGKVARQAVVYAGPSFTPEELRTLGLQDIQARLGSPKGPDGTNYVIAPSGTIPFMIVFANLPGNLSEFTAEVVGSDTLAPAAKAPAR